MLFYNYEDLTLWVQGAGECGFGWWKESEVGQRRGRLQVIDHCRRDGTAVYRRGAQRERARRRHQVGLVEVVQWWKLRAAHV